MVKLTVDVYWKADWIKKYRYWKREIVIKIIVEDFTNVKILNRKVWNFKKEFSEIQREYRNI